LDPALCLLNPSLVTVSVEVETTNAPTLLGPPPLAAPPPTPAPVQPQAHVPAPQVAPPLLPDPDPEPVQEAPEHDGFVELPAQPPAPPIIQVPIAATAASEPLGCEDIDIPYLELLLLTLQ
jgi:hypothetical protein